MAEFGTGCGVGTAWLRSGVRDGTRIVSAELDPDLAGAAAEIFADDDQVEVLAADWSTLSDRGPFSLLFLDAREPKDSGPDTVADLVEPGGMVVLDDFTPCESWPPVYGGRVDALRERWLTDERFTTVEVMVAPDTAVAHRHPALSFRPRHTHETTGSSDSRRRRGDLGDVREVALTRTE